MNGSHTEAIPESMVLSTPPGRRKKFGDFAWRRQRRTLVILLIMLTCTVLTAAVAQDSKESSEETPLEGGLNILSRNYNFYPSPGGQRWKP